MKKQQVLNEIKNASLAVAVKQALAQKGFSHREIAALCNVSAKTVHAHVNARVGSNVAKWENRKPEQQKQASSLAAKLLVAID